MPIKAKVFLSMPFPLNPQLEGCSDSLNYRLHALDLLCQKWNIIHYFIDLGKPAQNGKVERSHRSDQEIFYDRNKFKNLNELKKKIRLWNKEYNDLEHCGLNGKTFNEMLELLTIKNRQMYVFKTL